MGIVVVVIIVLVNVLTLLACCKVSGECSREEERQNGKTDG